MQEGNIEVQGIWECVHEGLYCRKFSENITIYVHSRFYDTMNLYEKNWEWFIPLRNTTLTCEVTHESIVETMEHAIRFYNDNWCELSMVARIK